MNLIYQQSGPFSPFYEIHLAEIIFSSELKQ